MKKCETSRLEGFFKKSFAQRQNIVAKQLLGTGKNNLQESIPSSLVDKMVENAVGTFSIPLGIATNFLINSHDVLVPMAIEEPSVIAAASNAAKMARTAGGFEANKVHPNTVAQIELLDPRKDAAEKILNEKQYVLQLADSTQPELVSLGGGARDLIVRPNVGGPERMVIHLVVDCKDAMGANVVNTMAEAISDTLSKLSGGRTGLRILSNLADRRLSRASCVVPFNALARQGFDGEQVARGVVAASDFASADPYRAATHNKGIFNGIDAVLMATGNDWRAVEAGGHAWAAQTGQYGPLATWRLNQESLVGQIELPMAVGIVGGASRIHPTARMCIELLGVETAEELAQVVSCVGLATNLAALAALSSEGIQKGHMRLHERKNQGEK